MAFHDSCIDFCVKNAIIGISLLRKGMPSMNRVGKRVPPTLVKVKYQMLVFSGVHQSDSIGDPSNSPVALVPIQATTRHQRRRIMI